MSTPLRSLPLMVALGTLALGALAPSAALACDMAEKLRLADEAKKLAARNAWSGVERAYVGMEATKCELGFDEHFLGSQSARYLGKTWEMYERLTAAKAFEEKQEILDNLAALDANYGRVDLKGDARRRPELTRADMPFAPDQRKSIEWAQTVVANTGSFYGMLPLGSYSAAGIDFTVEAGPEFSEVIVGKVRPEKTPKGGDEVAASAGSTSTSGEQGFINYAHVVATIGPNFIATPEPGSPVLDSAGDHQFEPASIFASGFSIMAGGELGLTYRAPEAGVAGLLGYSGGFGGDKTMHVFTGWAAGVVRPGDLRLALGPSYSFVQGSGTGVADWFDRGQNPESDPVASIPYQGFALAGGVTGSVGYGLLDFDKLQGVVELGGSWQSDGHRSYMGFGLRVGVVPTVPRFEG